MNTQQTQTPELLAIIALAEGRNAFANLRASHAEMMEALEAVLDCYGDSDSLLMMQCRRALDNARRGK
jgi:hypothetical protein